MNFSELIKIRQSDRKYEDRAVEKEKIIQCIEAARLSPSANNVQPWKFIVIDEPELKKKIDSAVSGQGMNKFAAQVPVIVAVVLERSSTLTNIASVLKNKEYSLLDIGIAANQFCLQAAYIGLGTCIIGWFDETKVKKLLHVPRGKRVPLVITVGYSQSSIRDKSRKPIEKMSSWNSY